VMIEKFWSQGIRSIEQLRQNPSILSHAQQLGLKYVDECVVVVILCVCVCVCLNCDKQVLLAYRSFGGG
jgi:hypothetical protein